MDVRILIVDDHAAVREALRFVFAALGLERIMEASSCGEAFDTMRDSRVDVVLLDIALGEENGLDALREMKAIAPDAAVLVHSYSDNSRLLSQSFHEGAVGYVVKGEDKNALIHAVRNAAAGDRVWTVAQLDRIRELDAAYAASNSARSGAVYADSK